MILKILLLIIKPRGNYYHLHIHNHSLGKIMDYAIILVSILLLPFSAGTQKVTTEGCYQTVDCFLLPQDCTSSDNCDVLVKYKFDPINGVFLITLSTNGKWVGFAQTYNLNKNQKMENIKGEICFNNNSVATLANLHGLSNTKPMFSRLVSGITVEETYVLPSGSVVCKYNRSLLVPVGSEDFMYSLNEPVNVVYAHGVNLRSDGYPTYHGYGNYSYLSDKIDMKSVRHRSNSSFDLSKCGKEFNCFRHPPSCTNTCNAVATFEYNAVTQTIYFNLWASKLLKWVAFGQKPDNDGNFMIKVRGEYCIRLPKVGFGNFNGNNLNAPGQPQWVPKVDQVKLLSSEVMPDGSILCRYERPVKLSNENIDYLYDMSDPLYAALAYGAELSGSFPAYHDGYEKSQDPINFKKIQDINFDTIAIILKKTHGSLMVLSWILFATCGIFTSRYMKPFLTSKIAGKDAWFRMHHMFMILAVLCFVAGFVIILVHFKGKFYPQGDIHHWLGLSAFILGLLQPVLAAFRCAPDHQNRYIFNWVHRLIGMSAWLTAVTAIVFGLKKFSIDFFPVIIYACVVLMLFVTLDVIQLFQSKCSYGKYECYAKFSAKTESCDNLQVPNTQKVEKSPTCHYIFMAVIYAISCGVAVYYVVTISKS